MPKATKPSRVPPSLSEAEAHQIITFIDTVSANFKGDMRDLEAAIGMYMVGRIFGWKVLALLHNKRTIKKYETVLGGINIRLHMEPTTEFSNKSVAFDIVTQLGNFWKGVNGEYDNEELRMRRSEVAL